MAGLKPLATIQAGFHARIAGHEIHACPYDRKSERRKYVYWMAGWIDADRALVKQSVLQTLLNEPQRGPRKGAQLAYSPYN